MPSELSSQALADKWPQSTSVKNVQEEYACEGLRARTHEGLDENGAHSTARCRGGAFLSHPTLRPSSIFLSTPSCASQILRRTMMHASKSMYLALFFAKTFLSFFLDVRPVMLDETSDIARAKDGDPCKTPRSVKTPRSLQNKRFFFCTETTSVNLVSNGQVHRRAPTLPSRSVHFTSGSQWRRKCSRRWCSCVEEHACRRTVPLFGAASEFQLVRGLRP